MKVKFLFNYGSERSYISKKAQNIWKLTLLNSEKLKINTYDSENSKVTTGQQVNFLIKTADSKFIETEAYTAPLICLPFQNHPLQIA